MTDGPFAETKEPLLGYFIVDGPGMDEAVEWAGKCPGAHHGAVEVRASGKYRLSDPNGAQANSRPQLRQGAVDAALVADQRAA